MTTAAPELALVHPAGETHEANDEGSSFNFVAFVRECEAELDAPDLDALTQLVAERLPDTEKDAVLRRALKALVLDVIGRSRRKKSRGAVSRPAGSARWDRSAAHVRSGALEYYRMWVNLDRGQSMHLGDCTAKDLAQVIAVYKRRAVDLADQAQRFQAVLRELRKRNAETVREIPAERLVEIFNA